MSIWQSIPHFARTPPGVPYFGITGRSESSGLKRIAVEEVVDEVNREKTNCRRLRQERREIHGLHLAFCPVSLPPGSFDAIRYRARGPLSLVLILVQQTVCRHRRRPRYDGVCCIVTSSYPPRRITFPSLHLVDRSVQPQHPRRALSLAELGPANPRADPLLSSAK